MAENVGDQEKAEQLIGAVKGEVVEGSATTTEEIGDVVDQAAQEMEIKLSPERPPGYYRSDGEDQQTGSEYRQSERTGEESL